MGISVPARNCSLWHSIRALCNLFQSQNSYWESGIVFSLYGYSLQAGKKGKLDYVVRTPHSAKSSFRFEISLSENWHNWGNSNIEHFGNAFSGILVCVCQFYGTLHLWSILANLSSNFSSREIRVTVNTFVCPWLPIFIGPDYELVQIFSYGIWFWS